MRLGDEATLAAVAELMGEAARAGVAVLAHAGGGGGYRTSARSVVRRDRA